MFTHFKNIDSAFKHIKGFTIALIAAYTALVGFCIWKSDEAVDRAQHRIHILYNGKVLEAIAADRETNLPVELRDHIRTFHEDFFSLAPDDKQIQATISKALYLADGSARDQYNDLKEKGYYNNLISGNISQQIMVDSIRLDINSAPYGFTCYATEKLIRASSTVTRRLVTTGRVRDIRQQTDNNPHGFLIENWQIVENPDESTKNTQP